MVRKEIKKMDLPGLKIVIAMMIAMDVGMEKIQLIMMTVLIVMMGIIIIFYIQIILEHVLLILKLRIVKEMKSKMM